MHVYYTITYSYLYNTTPTSILEACFYDFNTMFIIVFVPRYVNC